MDMAYRNLLTETFIKGNIKRVSFMARESIAGQMDLLMKVILLKEVDKVREIGSPLEKEETFILVDIKTIKNVDMVDIYGQMDVFIKVISKMISKMVKED